MIKVLFICHGNICRSPMAEFIFKDIVHKKGLDDLFEIASCATSAEELGNPVYPPARAILARHGISCKGKYARQITATDYDKYDLLIAMESYNIRNLSRIIKADPLGKIHRLMDYTPKGGDVADPWYTGDFEITYENIYTGCCCLLDNIMTSRK